MTRGAGHRPMTPRPSDEGDSHVNSSVVTNGRAAIVTLTMNPALDVCVSTATVRPTDKVRCTDPRYDAGGGGINVARVAHALGASVSSVFAAGGPTGILVTDLVAQAGIPARLVDVAGLTRESLTVDETSSGLQYRFVLPGPTLTTDEQSRCLEQLAVAAASAEFVVASGSLPPGVPPDFYQRVADLCLDLGALLVLDASGRGFEGVTHGAFLIKPSLRELREHVRRPLDTQAEQVAAARELIADGRTQAVVVSLGADGALLVTSTASHRFAAVPIRARSGVGAGDAMVAAVTVGLCRAWSLTDSVRFGMAAAAAMLMTPGTACPARAEVERLYEITDAPVRLEA